MSETDTVDPNVAVSDPPVAEGVATPAAATPTPPAPEPRFVPLDRFNGIVAQKYDAIRKSELAEQRAKELEREVGELRQRIATPPPGSDPNAPPVPPAPRLDPNEVNRLARIQAAQMLFNERCTESVVAGRKQYSDFDAVVDDLRKVAPAVGANGQPELPTSLIEAALETGHAHEVLYALGKDSSEADRVMSLSPIKQAVELSKIAARFDKPASGDGKTPPAADPVIIQRGPGAALPEPITPVVGAQRGIDYATLALDDPRIPIDQWIARRDAESKRSRAANGRFR